MKKVPQITIIGYRAKTNLSPTMWRDVIARKNVTYFTDAYNKNTIFWHIFKAYRRFCKIFNLWKHVSAEYRDSILNDLHTLSIPQDTDILIVSHFSMNKLSQKKMDEVKRRGGKIILFLFDPLHSNIEKNTKAGILDRIANGTIDRVYSFDDRDCLENGFHKVEQVYSSLKFKELPKINLDLYFSGRKKKRYEMILETIHRCATSGGTVQARIPDLTEEQKNKITTAIAPLGNFQGSFIHYEEQLAEMLQSSCILDITQDVQEGFTFRILEAICYNRKLLTNNKSVLTNKYYNPACIQYFEKVEDIDFDWVLDRTPVEFNYQEDYSPNTFIDRIIAEYPDL